MTRYRPELDIEAVAQGDVWFGEDALSVGLVDRIASIDDELMQMTAEYRVLAVKYSQPKTLGSRLQQSASTLIQQIMSRLGLHG